MSSRLKIYDDIPKQIFAHHIYKKNYNYVSVKKKFKKMIGNLQNVYFNGLETLLTDKQTIMYLGPAL